MFKMPPMRSAKPVKSNDFSQEPPELQHAQTLAFQRVLQSGWWVLGPEVRAFEEKWATQSSTAHAVGVANGLDALEICLRAMQIGIGDEVITTPVTAYATTLAIQRCGAVPVFADINPSTACISPDSIKQCVTSSTKAVLPVHLYGRCADLDSISEICSQNDLFLIEDCAQSHGAVYDGKPVGSIGDCGAWSFYPTKNLGAIGDAGAISTNNDSIAEAARCLRNYGQEDRYRHQKIGFNSRLDELQAAILLERLPYLQDWTRRRREIASKYKSGILHPCIQHLAEESDPLRHVHHLYVVRCTNRAHALEHLRESGIPCLIHYPLASTQQQALGPHRVAPDGILHALEHCSSCLSLPIHPYLSDDEVNYVIDSVNNLPASL